MSNNFHHFSFIDLNSFIVKGWHLLVKLWYCICMERNRSTSKWNINQKHTCRYRQLYFCLNGLIVVVADQSCLKLVSAHSWKNTTDLCSKHSENDQSFKYLFINLFIILVYKIQHIMYKILSSIFMSMDTTVRFTFVDSSESHEIIRQPYWSVSMKHSRYRKLISSDLSVVGNEMLVEIGHSLLKTTLTMSSYILCPVKHKAHQMQQ